MITHQELDLTLENRFNRRMHDWEQLPHHTLELQALIHTPGAHIDDGAGHKNRGTRPTTRPPWNQPAAHLYFDIHAEIRRLESWLTITLHHQAVYRGGSDQATRRIFDRLPTLLRELHDRDPDSTVLTETLTSLSSLTKRAHVALNPETRRRRAPYVTCHECDGDLWIYRADHRVHPTLATDEHFQPGDAYCNRCPTWYPQDIWQKVARTNAQVA